MAPTTKATREQVAQELDGEVFWTQGKGRPKRKGRQQPPHKRRNRDLTLGIEQRSSLQPEAGELASKTVILPPGVKS